VAGFSCASAPVTPGDDLPAKPDALQRVVAPVVCSTNTPDLLVEGPAPDDDGDGRGGPHRPSRRRFAVGAVYVWLDATVQAGLTYYYKLEDVDIYGHTTLHGPVQVGNGPAPDARE